ncbi:hypothetical protein N7510_003468 [Penicillium lagena]|uniref:uncharacterized protein n=1 Tax=Penicillium lagena TaxID=94218 RepID=UPI00254258F9|nr:uncharacterized protein N7510_003468 [Penicillium lagena]KAJ5619484.1 hypothetical protein N7510_003468 [Penicillium lagena]
MKFSNSVALTLATAGSLVAAQGHHHQHRHQHKRNADANTVVVPGPVVYDFVIADGDNVEAVSLEKACAGLFDKEFKWADEPVWAACSTSTTTTTTTTTTSTPTLTPTPAVLQETSAEITPTTTTTTTTVPPAPTANSGATGIDADFPDGEIDCTDFPSNYGAVPLDYLGLGGYSGIQYASWEDELISDIITAKSQWPEKQGSTGQSVGGLQCSGGKLYLTNSALSKKLCMPGVGGVFVRNEMSQQAAVCRTDYPGTESETIPLAATVGGTHPLTCPDAASYYKWQNSDTSAQYYVNPAGISTESGCQWGDGSSPIGNWAPMNLGVGQTSSGKWLSMFQNTPTTNVPLNFKVKLVGDDLGAECKYENGQFYQNGSPIDNGCTTQVMSGDATYVFYE